MVKGQFCPLQKSEASTNKAEEEDDTTKDSKNAVANDNNSSSDESNETGDTSEDLIPHCLFSFSFHFNV